MAVSDSTSWRIFESLCHLNDLLHTLQENGWALIYLLLKLSMSWRILKSLHHLNLHVLHTTGKWLFPTLYELMYLKITLTSE
jgi:hypothetical protein